MNPSLLKAGTQPITLRTGGSFVHHADSFAIARGCRLDVCVPGAFEASETGDIANRTRLADQPAEPIGGAMGLAIGAKRLWVMVERITKSHGGSRIRRRCPYPLTARVLVRRVDTDLAVTPHGFTVIDMIPGMTRRQLHDRNEQEPIFP